MYKNKTYKQIWKKGFNTSNKLWRKIYRNKAKRALKQSKSIIGALQEELEIKERQMKDTTNEVARLMKINKSLEDRIKILQSRMSQYNSNIIEKNEQEELNWIELKKLRKRVENMEKYKTKEEYLSSKSKNSHTVGDLMIKAQKKKEYEELRKKRKIKDAVNKVFDEVEQ